MISIQPLYTPPLPLPPPPFRSPTPPRPLCFLFNPSLQTAQVALLIPTIPRYHTPPPLPHALQFRLYNFVCSVPCIFSSYLAHKTPITPACPASHFWKFQVGTALQRYRTPVSHNKAPASNTRRSTAFIAHQRACLLALFSSTLFSRVLRLHFSL